MSYPSEAAPFEFATAGRIIFGAGKVAEVAPLAKGFGTAPLVVTGASAERASAALKLQGGVWLRVRGEPDIEWVRNAVRTGAAAGCDVVIGFGGGSAIDAGKAVAVLLANGGDVLDYLEVIGRGRALESPSLPYIAVPTTAGTGSEVTRNAVLGSREDGVKASLRSAYMLPRVAVVDPELTLTLPPAITASTGLDALTQLIEPYVSAKANPVTDALCLAGLPHVARSLRRAFHSGSSLEARTGMSFASLMGGSALANAALGIVHGFAAPVGGMFQAPHGAVCAALLPSAMDQNIRALRSRQPEARSLRRYAEVARILTEQDDAQPEDGVQWVRALVEELRIPGLSAYGVTGAHVPELVDKAAKASSTRGNPIALLPEEMAQIVTAALKL